MQNEVFLIVSFASWTTTVDYKYSQSQRPLESFIGFKWGGGESNPRPFEWGFLYASYTLHSILIGHLKFHFPSVQVYSPSLDEML